MVLLLYLLIYSFEKLERENNEKENNSEKLFDLERDFSQKELDILCNIVNRWIPCDSEDLTLDQYRFDKILSIRNALFVTHPEIEFARDKDIQERLNIEFAEATKAGVFHKIFQNALDMKFVYPEQYYALYDINQMESYCIETVERIKNESKLFSVYGMYGIMSEIKLLCPTERFMEFDLREIFGQYSIWDVIKKHIDQTYEISWASPHTVFRIAELLTAIKILDFPKKVSIGEETWKELKIHKRFFVQEKKYAELAQYIKRLYILGSEEIRITDNEFIVK